MVATKYYAAALAAATKGSWAFEDVIIAPSAELKWSPCGTNFFCAKLEVPLDYTCKNQCHGRAAVPLLKYAAASNSTDGPYQGMVVAIPGGPGGSGVDLVRDSGSALQAVIGSNWDIVSFDPRGMFRSEPALDCTGNSTRRDTVPRLSNGFYDGFLEYGREIGDRCAQRSGADSAGPHMSTAVVARDLVSIADAYARTPEGRSAAKNSSLLNFYGISYGTMVGQTFASMFPERVGNAVLDAVVGPESYLSGWITNSINHLDGVLALFFIYCSAAPSRCPYATGNSAQDTFARFKASFTQLDARSAEAAHWSNSTDIAKALLTLKSTALGAAYTPLASFENFSQVLVGLEAALDSSMLDSGMLKQWTQQLIASTGDPGPAGQVLGEYTLAVACSDQNNMYYGRTLEELQPQIQSLKAQSIIGELWMKNSLGCTGWKIKTNIFTGPFGGDTATPMLFVSNTYDPVTPIENSRSGAPKYKNAQILTVDAMGHVTALTNNQCAFAKVRAYFQSTQLPGQDNFCATESAPFGVMLNGTLQENIQKAGLSDLHF